VADSVTFVAHDTTTKGTWGGVYGASGYSWKGGADTFESLPAGVTLTENASLFTWVVVGSGVAPKDPQVPPGFTQRWACTRYGSAVAAGGPPSVRFQMPGPMRVGLYFLDWDTSRPNPQTILWTATAGGATLDSRASNAAAGFADWLVYDIDGDVTMTVLYGGSPNPNGIVSGLTFDPVPGGGGGPAGGFLSLLGVGG
jgi:hypothetical protein